MNETDLNESIQHIFLNEKDERDKRTKNKVNNKKNYIIRSFASFYEQSIIPAGM
jgi:hypothetical protein